ncbi:MAG: hypothetical protein HY664_08570 [Chloroflexi bacterium]|nr:hypothetical protein [Chloroflexota bacterium]
MKKWLVRLKGEEFDLEDLATEIRSPSFNVAKENDYYYLTSLGFNSLTTADDVRAKATELIRVINGAASLTFAKFQGVEFDALTLIEPNGRRHNYIYLAATLTARARVSATLTTVNSEGTEDLSQQPTEMESWVTLAMQERDVADCLHFFRDGTWFSLYKVYEIVRDDSGRDDRRIIRNGWATKSELSRFRGTAQSQAALGVEARHASKRYKPPSEPMSISEARSLIRDLLRNWLVARKQPTLRDDPRPEEHG